MSRQTAASGHERHHIRGADRSLLDLSKRTGSLQRRRRLPRASSDSCTATNTHSISSSAPASIEVGTSMPSALAAFTLTTSLKAVGCSIGRSPGIAPLSILSTNAAERRRASDISGSVVHRRRRRIRSRPRGFRPRQRGAHGWMSRNWMAIGVAARGGWLIAPVTVIIEDGSLDTIHTVSSL